MDSASTRLSAPSIPPSSVLEAYARFLAFEASGGDKDIVAAFHILYTEPFVEDARVRWIAPLPLQVNLNKSRAEGESWRPRRPF